MEIKEVVKIAVHVVLQILIAPYSLILILMATRAITKTKKPIYREEPIFKSDKRFKSGGRQIGTRRVKTGEYIKVTEQEKDILINKARRYLLSVSCAIIVYAIMFVIFGILSIQ